MSISRLGLLKQGDWAAASAAALAINRRQPYWSNMQDRQRLPAQAAAAAASLSPKELLSALQLLYSPAATQYAAATAWLLLVPSFPHQHMIFLDALLGQQHIFLPH